MDQNQDLEDIEHFESLWNEWPKNQLWQGVLTTKNHPAIFFACEIGQYRILSSASVGPRGGIREQLMILDFKQAITIDRLILADSASLYEGGYLLPLADMRYQVKREGKQPFDVCHQAMQKILDDVLARPDHYIGLIPTLERQARSVPRYWMFRAGAPGQSKR